MKNEHLAGRSPEQIAAGRRWVQAWKEAGPRLERIRREELRRLDPQRAIALLCGEADYTKAPARPAADVGAGRAAALVHAGGLPPCLS